MRRPTWTYMRLLAARKPRSASRSPSGGSSSPGLDEAGEARAVAVRVTRRTTDRGRDDLARGLGTGGRDRAGAIGWRGPRRSCSTGRSRTRRGGGGVSAGKWKLPNLSPAARAMWMRSSSATTSRAQMTAEDGQAWGRARMARARMPLSWNMLVVGA
jgi:hypothetical protein